MRTATKLKLAGRGVEGIASTGYSAGRLVGGVQARGQDLRKPLIAGAAGGAFLGAALAFFADPVSGRERRAALKAKLAALANKGEEPSEEFPEAQTTAAAAVETTISETNGGPSAPAAYPPADPRADVPAKTVG